MASISDKIADSYLTYAVDIEQFSAGVQEEVTQLLRRAEMELVEKLSSINPTQPLRPSFRQLRLEKTLAESQNILGRTYKDAMSLAHRRLLSLGSVEAKVPADIINSSIGVNLASPGLSPELLESIVSETLVQGAPSKEWWGRQSVAAQNRFSDQIKLGMVQQESLDDLVKRVRGTSTGKRVQYRDNNGKIRYTTEYKGGMMDVNTRQAKALVRTSVQSVSQAARFSLYQKNSDVIEGVQAVVTLDNRTSDICMARSGMAWTLAGEPYPGTEGVFPGSPPWHFQCRTTLIPVLFSYNSLRDSAARASRPLSIDVARINPLTQSSMDGQVSRNLNYESWLRTKDKSFQLSVLGKAKHALWEAGQLSFRDLVDQTGNSITVQKFMSGNGVVPEGSEKSIFDLSNITREQALKIAGWTFNFAWFMFTGGTIVFKAAWILFRRFLIPWLIRANQMRRYNNLGVYPKGWAPNAVHMGEATVVPATAQGAAGLRGALVATGRKAGSVFSPGFGVPAGRTGVVITPAEGESFLSVPIEGQRLLPAPPGSVAASQPKAILLLAPPGTTEASLDVFIGSLSKTVANHVASGKNLSKFFRKYAPDFAGGLVRIVPARFLNVGDIITSPGPTLYAKSLKPFEVLLSESSSNVVIRILPTDTPIGYDISGLSSFAAEGEVLVPQGVSFTVAEVNLLPRTAHGSTGVIEYVLEVVPDTAPMATDHITNTLVQNLQKALVEEKARLLQVTGNAEKEFLSSRIIELEKRLAELKPPTPEFKPPPPSESTSLVVVDSRRSFNDFVSGTHRPDDLHANIIQWTKIGNRLLDTIPDSLFSVYSPNVSVTSYRALFSEFFNLEKGSIFVDGRFTSYSQSLKGLDAYTSQYNPDISVPVILKVRGGVQPYAYDISSFSLYASEAEVIVPPGMKFRVVAVNKGKQYKGIGEVDEYVLEVFEDPFRPLQKFIPEFQPLPKATSTGQSQIVVRTEQELSNKAREIVTNIIPDATRRQDLWLKEFAHYRWGNQASRIVTDDVFKQTEGILMVRGVSNVKYLDVNLNGEWYGWGVNGNGLYFSQVRNLEALNNSVAAYGSPGSGGWVYLSKLSSDARVITTTELKKITTQQNRLLGSTKHVTELTVGEYGRQAAVLGYDAILVEETGVVVVLNQSKIIVNKKFLPGGAFEKELLDVASKVRNRFPEATSANKSLSDAFLADQIELEVNNFVTGSFRNWVAEPLVVAPKPSLPPVLLSQQRAKIASLEKEIEQEIIKKEATSSSSSFNQRVRKSASDAGVLLDKRITGLQSKIGQFKKPVLLKPKLTPSLAGAEKLKPNSPVSIFNKNNDIADVANTILGPGYSYGSIRIIAKSGNSITFIGENSQGILSKVSNTVTRKSDTGIIKIVRTLYLDEKGLPTTIKHDSLYVKKGVDGTKVAGALLSASMDNYIKLGIKKVTLYAHTHAGAYAWPRYGFIPVNKHQFIESLTERYQELVLDKGFTKGKARIHVTQIEQDLVELLGTDNSLIAQKVADYTYLAEPVGKKLMFGMQYEAELNIGSTFQMELFGAHVGKSFVPGKPIPKAESFVPPTATKTTTTFPKSSSAKALDDVKVKETTLIELEKELARSTARQHAQEVAGASVEARTTVLNSRLDDLQNKLNEATLPPRVDTPVKDLVVWNSQTPEVYPILKGSVIKSSNGKLVTMYRGSNRSSNQADIDLPLGWFTNRIDVAENFGPIITRAFLAIHKPIKLDKYSRPLDIDNVNEILSNADIAALSQESVEQIINSESPIHFKWEEGFVEPEIMPYVILHFKENFQKAGYDGIIVQDGEVEKIAIPFSNKQVIDVETGESYAPLSAVESIENLEIKIVAAQENLARYIKEGAIRQRLEGLPNVTTHERAILVIEEICTKEMLYL